MKNKTGFGSVFARQSIAPIPVGAPLDFISIQLPALAAMQQSITKINAGFCAISGDLTNSFDRYRFFTRLFIFNTLLDQNMQNLSGFKGASYNNLYNSDSDFTPFITEPIHVETISDENQPYNIDFTEQLFFQKTTNFSIVLLKPRLRYSVNAEIPVCEADYWLTVDGKQYPGQETWKTTNYNVR